MDGNVSAWTRVRFRNSIILFSSSLCSVRRIKMGGGPLGTLTRELPLTSGKKIKKIRGRDFPSGPVA